MGIKGVVAFACLLIALAPRDGDTQTRNQFGRQDRANAAKRSLVLAVQQGISTLPPTSGQSVIYEFDPQSDAPARSEQLGPVSLRAPHTLPKGQWSFRMASSYFRLSEKLGPVEYLFNFDNGARSRFALLGTEIHADVGLINLSLNYGINNWIELVGNVPIVVIDAHADQTYTSDPTLTRRNIGFSFSRAGLRDDVAAGRLVERRTSFRSLGASFDDGLQAGIGRISLGEKMTVLRRRDVQLAVSTEFFFASPSEGDYAGSESFAVLPRAIAAWRLTHTVRLHADVGYDYDFEVDELRRIVWNVGASFAFHRVTFDCGVGGSKFHSGIEWTSRRTRGASGQAGASTDMTATTFGDTNVGSNFIDVLAGVKFQIAENTFVSGALNIPVNDDGVRPDAVGTVAVETYF
jgi:hypothetical protein